jgi:sugar-specific transcriptional regulator TrmB
MDTNTKTKKQPDIKDSMAALGLKPGSQEVLLYLIEHGVSSVAEISHSLSTPKSSIYDALEELVRHSLVTEYSENRSKTFGVSDVNQIIHKSNQSLERLKHANELLVSYIQTAEPIRQVSKPKIKFYFGDDGIRQAFRDTMWHKDCKETFLMWPTKEMVDILTPEFCDWHASGRIEHGVMMYVIHKESDKKWENRPEAKQLNQTRGWADLRELRYAPKNMNWSMSYWIYDDKCLFASGGAEHFAFVVQSREFVELMKILWKQVWEVSEKE